MNLQNTSDLTVLCALYVFLVLLGDFLLFLVCLTLFVPCFQSEVA